MDIDVLDDAGYHKIAGCRRVFTSMRLWRRSRVPRYAQLWYDNITAGITGIEKYTDVSISCSFVTQLRATVQVHQARVHFVRLPNTKSRACDFSCADNTAIPSRSQAREFLSYNSFAGPPAASPCHLMGNAAAHVCMLLVCFSVHVLRAHPTAHRRGIIAADGVPLTIPCLG